MVETQKNVKIKAKIANQVQTSSKCSKSTTLVSHLGETQESMVLEIRAQIQNQIPF